MKRIANIRFDSGKEKAAVMMIKKLRASWKAGLLAMSIFMIFSFPGCEDMPPDGTQTAETESAAQGREETKEAGTAGETEDTEDAGTAEDVAGVCLDLWQKAAEEHKESDLEMVRSIVTRFGENGYSAVDSRNQIDMTRAEQVVEFCEKAEAGEETELTLIEVTYLGGFVKYDFLAKDGSVNVVSSYYKYENGDLRSAAARRYPAENWCYTQEGYFMFSGSWFSEEIYALTSEQAEEGMGFRVQPLDETCRELNRNYLLPIGYVKNNMFLTDWTEDDFGELNFYDMFDIFYPKENAEPVPYVPDDNLGVGAVYQIPKEEFEQVIMAYFNIKGETLQSKTSYDSEDKTYEYKPRGFYEGEYPEHPYPEVVGYTSHSDGTISLRVHAVFPYAGNSKVYAHEVVIRPLKDGGVQYVSNRVLSPEGDYEVTWHTPRMTGEEWEETYGE